MSNPLKKLAGQTAIYGLGTIVPRLLNYLLVPLYTHGLLAESEYGIITELFAYMAFFLVLLMYGMETSFFRHAEKTGNSPKVFATSIISVFFTSLLFVLVVLIFVEPISELIQHPQHQDYIVYLAIIISIDAFTAIQFAYLRQQNKAVKFSVIRLITVAVNVALNLYFIWFCDGQYKSDPDSPFLIFYDPEFREGYVFVSNLVASILAVILLLPQLIKTKMILDFGLLKKMIKYAFPLLIVGLAGMINEVSDKIIFKYLVKVPEGIEDAEMYVMSELGIYGANYKLAVLMTLFIQMFRYAVEPFFFSHAKKDNAKQLYADVMKYFVIFGLLIFLGVTLYIDVFKNFIGPKFWDGLHIVPIVLLANLFLGIFFNLSVWYKLNDLTKYGAIIALTGSVITIIINIIFVPRISYLGSAWGHFACYLIMIIISYFLGRKFFPVKYDIKRIGSYFIFAMILFAMSFFVQHEILWIRLLINTFILGLFLSVVFLSEKNSLKSMKSNM